MKDAQIVALYLSRSEDAIKCTAEKYGARLQSLSFGIVQDAQTAEECENDTYLEAWNRIPPHEPADYFYAFLARITRNLSLNRCRERSCLKRQGTSAGSPRSWSSVSPLRTTPPDAWTIWPSARSSTVFSPRSPRKNALFFCGGTGIWTPWQTSQIAAA